MPWDRKKIPTYRKWASQFIAASQGQILQNPSILSCYHSHFLPPFLYICRQLKERWLILTKTAYFILKIKRLQKFYVTEMAKLYNNKMSIYRKWYAIYTRPRWEKKVNSLLSENGFESYCPLNKVRRKWSDRYKLIEEPLFKSYVFVKIEDAERTAVRMTSGVINFVYGEGKPAVIREKEIQNIKKFLDEYENVELSEITSFKPHQRVKVTYGPLMDQEGEVLKVKNKQVQVAIDSLGYILIASIDKRKLISF